MKEFIMNRLREPSTWRGLILMLTALGVKLEPQQIEAIVTFGLATVGAIGVFVPDSKPAGLPWQK